MVSASDTSVSRTSSFRDKRRSLVAAGVGNALEWFDWNLYGIFSVYLAVNAFDSADPTSGLLATLAVFAVGFVARPIGGLFFGRLSDRLGRKTILIVTMCLLAASSVALAVMPTYDQVGVVASAFLLVARLIQGVAHGGRPGWRIPTPRNWRLPTAAGCGVGSVHLVHGRAHGRHRLRRRPERAADQSRHAVLRVADQVRLRRVAGTIRALASAFSRGK